MAIKSEKTEIPGIKFIKSRGGISEYELKSNQLQILLKENSVTPTVTVMVTYRVGSRHEVLGNTGATHILEHMLFKGSRKFNKKNGKDQANYLQKMGASINATTWLDRTNYFETLPSKHLEEAIALEADRMRFSFISDVDLKTEMPVVLNEFECGENDPVEALDKQIWASAFQMHPYHHSTIGWREDILNTNAAKLRAFYDTYYYPNNATLTVIGDFDKSTLLRWVKKYFGEHAAKQDLPKMSYVEPKQEGERRVVVERPGTTNIVGIAFKAPNGRHRDSNAMQAAAFVLGVGDTSRLSRRLVESGFCSRIDVSSQPFHDESLVIIYAYLNIGSIHQKIEEIIKEEFQSLRENGISKEELERFKRKTKVEMAWNRDKSIDIAGSLNQAIATGDWTLYTDLLKNIQSMSTDDVKRVAVNYFLENQSTVGYFVGKGK